MCVCVCVCNAVARKTAVARHFIPKKARKKHRLPLLKIPKQFDQFGKFWAVLARPCCVFFSDYRKNTERARNKE